MASTTEEVLRRHVKCFFEGVALSQRLHRSA
jgi:hypothetical protein